MSMSGSSEASCGEGGLGRRRLGSFRPRRTALRWSILRLRRSRRWVVDSSGTVDDEVFETSRGGVDVGVWRFCLWSLAGSEGRGTVPGWLDTRGRTVGGQ